MKYIVLFFLLLANVSWAADKKTEEGELREELRALTGLHKFDVTTFVLSYDKSDENKIYDSVIEAFKKLGQTSVSESESLIRDIMRIGAIFPSCCCWIEKKEGGVKITLEVLAEVEVLANKHRTACPVWQKILYSAISMDDNQADLTITNLAQDMIKSFGEDWKKANNLNSKQPSFHIRKFESL